MGELDRIAKAFGLADRQINIAQLIERDFFAKRLSIWSDIGQA